MYTLAEEELRVCMCVCIYIYIYMCVCVCVCVCVRILTDGLTLQQVTMWSLADTCFHHSCSLVGVY